MRIHPEQKRISWLMNEIQFAEAMVPRLIDRAETWLAAGNQFMFEHCMKLTDELCGDLDKLRGELLHLVMSV